MSPHYSSLATTDYGNIIGREQFMDFSIHALWSGMESISGPAFTVQMTPGDNLMLHAAVYEAPAGSIIVADAGDCSHAVAGGNVCAVAQKKGITGFIIDGVVRDIQEIDEAKFPVYGKGVFPVPGKKEFYSELCQPIICGGVKVHTGDIIVADREGIAVLPKDKAENIFLAAKEKADLEAKTSLAEWEHNHQNRVLKALAAAKQ